MECFYRQVNSLGVARYFDAISNTSAALQEKQEFEICEYVGI